MKKTRNPLSRANLSSPRLVVGWLALAAIALAAFMLSQIWPATLLVALPVAVICQAMAFVALGTFAYRLIVPCPVCKYGQNAPTADAWTCPHCKIGFKAAEREHEGAGPWG